MDQVNILTHVRYRLSVSTIYTDAIPLLSLHDAVSTSLESGTERPFKNLVKKINLYFDTLDENGSTKKSKTFLIIK